MFTLILPIKCNKILQIFLKLSTFNYIRIFLVTKQTHLWPQWERERSLTIVLAVKIFLKTQLLLRPQEINTFVLEKILNKARRSAR